MCQRGACWGFCHPARPRPLPRPLPRRTSSSTSNRQITVEEQGRPWNVNTFCLISAFLPQDYLLLTISVKYSNRLMLCVHLTRLFFNCWASVVRCRSDISYAVGWIWGMKLCFTSSLLNWLFCWCKYLSSSWLYFKCLNIYTHLLHVE